jgi:TonB family protein
MASVEHPPADPGVTPPVPPEVRPRGVSSDPEDLQLLLSWAPDPAESARTRAAVVGTLLVHLFLIGGAWNMPTQTANRPRRPERRTLIVTKIFDPPTELTQKAPNKGTPVKEIAVQTPAPAIPVPTPDPGAHSRKFSPPPMPQPTKQPTAAPSLIEPPKIEQAQNNSPQLQLPQLPSQAPPPERPNEKPKLAFETPTAPTGPKGTPKMSLPAGGTIQDAVRDLSRGGNRGTSGSETFDLGGGAGLNMPPSTGRQRLDWELKFDPQGVDFRPYVLQVLAIIKRNWLSVYPESAKLGTRGQVKLEFSIAKNGSVNKIAWGFQSGIQALDRAAVAGVSASNPLPPLPADFKGDRIVLAFTFSYNLGR